MWIVVTDLDGTLLNHHDYSWEGARPALETLEQRGIPVVFCTSKTRAEVEVLRHAIGNRHPFITENGGAVYLPVEAFARLEATLPRREGYFCIQLGTAYAELVTVLAEAARETGCRVWGFADATVAEVAAWCGFSEGEALLAKQRDFDEPFLLESGDGGDLESAIARHGLRTTRGGRFWHILGNNDKGVAVRKLRDAYLQASVPVSVVALGDSPNDLPLLEQAEIPVLMPGPRLPEMRSALPQAIVAPLPGSAGWGAAMLEILSTRLQGATLSGQPW